ncbi:MAG TPA: DUF1015 domain-containing protein [Jiangellaceae bacterium]
MDERVDARASATPWLELAPFRALRYNPGAVPDLGAVTCPPYDVINAHGVETFEAADPHNIVRLILPRPIDDTDKYERAAADLRAWRAAGVFERDDEPGLYVYELTHGDHVTAGLVGAVSVHDVADRRVLPHEDVFAGAVVDRTSLMLATQAQLEPILLTYDGDGAASDVVDDTLQTAPLLEVATADGALHRLWRITDPGVLATVQADLAERQALIADGHHRYAAYRALRDHPAAPDGAGHGLAMLVDARRHPLRLGAIHRSVGDLGWDDALAAARGGFAEVSPASLDDFGGGAPGWPRLVLSDGERHVVLSEPDAALVAASMPSQASDEWRRLAASLLCEFVLAKLLGVPDTDPRVAYHHSRDDAIRRAQETGGVALLLPSAALSDVLTLAARGERMPRKSTSFGPKPRTGLLIRLLDE